MRTLAISALAVLLSAPVNAQWFHQENGGAFSSAPTQLAMTARGDYAFGIRCTDADDLVAVFITPEIIDATTAEVMTAFIPRLLVRVDQNDPFELEASVEMTPQGMGLSSDTTFELAKQINEASSSVSVAMRSLGEVYHETQFNVRGSTATTNTLIENCNLSGG